MEVRKVPTNEQRKEVLNSYIIPETGDMECGDITIDESGEYFEVIVKKEEKLDQFDLSSVLFDFINSPYFTAKKYFLFGKIKVHFEEKQDYNVIFSKLNPVFKKVAI